MSLLTKFSSNARLAEDGKEFQISDEGWVTLRRSDSKIARKIREEAEAGYTNRAIPEAKQREILIRVMALGIMVSWRGKDWADPETGEEIPFSSGTALEILSDKDREPLLDALYKISNQYESFRVDEVKKLEGN